MCALVILVSAVRVGSYLDCMSFYIAPDRSPSSRYLRTAVLTNMLRDFEHYSVKQLELG